MPQFQRVIDDIVMKEGLKDTYPYLDNVTIGGASQEEHDHNVQRFLDAITRYGMELNQSKTVSSVSEIRILGYCVGGNKIRPDPERLRPLLEFPAPTDSKSLKRALGMFAYYAKRITNYSDKIVHLKNSKTFPLTTEALKEYEALKMDIAKASLQAIDENCPFVVECDASKVAISATLNQAG